MRLRVGAVKIYMIINWLQVKKKEEYIKLLVIQQNYSKRCTNDFMFKVCIKGFLFT